MNVNKELCESTNVGGNMHGDGVWWGHVGWGWDGDGDRKLSPCSSLTVALAHALIQHHHSECSAVKFTMPILTYLLAQRNVQMHSFKQCTVQYITYQ